MIEVENLVKRYGSHLAVDHLSFQVEPGKIYGFLGPNGAGKSTTMNMMTGYIAPTEGTVRINGFDIQKNAEEAKRCIGYLPEIPPLYQDMTVLEYLRFAAALKKIPKKEVETQLADIMEMTMTADVSERLIKNLSKGYKQRVGLAQAILGYPEVIILDEPTVGLDPKQIIEIRELIRNLAKRHTVILSSHILSEVQAVCDEILILSKGKLVACDTPEGLTGLMKGNATLEVHILGSEEALRKVLPFIAGITEFTIEKAPEQGAVKAVIQTEAGEDIREELFYALAENKLPILSMNRVEKSLEDIFLELTEDQDGTSGTDTGEDAGDTADTDDTARQTEDTANGQDTAEQMNENEGGNEDEGNL